MNRSGLVLRWREAGACTGMGLGQPGTCSIGCLARVPDAVMSVVEADREELLGGSRR